ncbi:MFS family permease [Microbacterium resistens]|uniref:MFS family permease n=1 Tax=Microbacterium resistens TaxID=156977 RepID=A0ABU1SBW4_9MICO|nr:MFS transporter [Microbacterium resistens]MDR6867090.1 MFS family permease [Microbacterium resistens]
MSDTVTAPQQPPAEDQSGTLSPIAGRRLLPSLTIAWFVLFAAYLGLTSVLLPNHMAGIDEGSKVANFAIVTTVASIVAMFSQPIVGALSDRTRSRLGRRAPWMLGGALLGALSLVVLGSLRDLLSITIVWAVMLISLNALQGPLSAITPDRFPRSRRGVASAAVGIGTLAGATLGVVLAGRIAADVGVGYTVFGGAVFVVTVVFLLVNRDRSSAGATFAPFRWRTFLAGFWVDPRRHPDFAWAFVARFLFILGYFLVFTYQLFILTDFVGMPLAEANVQVGVLSMAAFASTFVSVLLAGWLSDRFTRRKAFIYVASAIMMAGLLVPLFLSDMTGMLLMFTIKGFGYGLYMSCDTALMTEVLPGGGTSAAKDLGILNIATNIPQALSPAVAALIIGGLGGYPALFVVAVVCIGLAALALIPIRGVR